MSTKAFAKLDSMEPGIEMEFLLASLDVDQAEGRDLLILLRAHHRMATYFQALADAEMAALADAGGDLPDEPG